MSMLILTRLPEERILIGDNIVVEVLHVRGQQVRLGVRAPKDVLVDREEVRARRDASTQAREAAHA